MLESNALSFLSWNPRILEHDRNYDDPWRRHRASESFAVGKKFGPAAPVIIVDVATGKEYTEPSLSATARRLGVNTGTIADKLRSGRMIRDRYVVRRAAAC